MARILIFEDDVDYAGLLQESLESAGHSVAVTDEGDEAIRLLASSEFDLALIDIFIHRNGKVVPDGGLLLLGRLSSRQSGRPGTSIRKVPVIAMSGHFDNKGLGEIDSYARSFGADEILAKPFTHDQLVAAMDRLLPDKSVTEG